MTSTFGSTCGLCVEVAQRDMCLLQQLQGRGAGGT